MRSQRIGQGFESPRLHHHKQTASQVRCRLLMAAKPAGERTCARHYIKQRVSLPSHFGSHCVRFIRARRFGGGRSRRFRPRRRPSGTTGLQIYIPRQTSALMAKLPSSRPAATPQSRCPSDFCVAGRGATARSPNPERNGKHMLKHRLKQDERSARGFGGGRSRRFRPSPPPGICQTSLPNAPHLHIPTLMAAGNIFHG